ncbi:MAG TPA: hypothetical protein VGU20_04220 [Stellaceae bacterium]|nr:hypothetical protein [Stellaceae bacterium]
MSNPVATLALVRLFRDLPYEERRAMLRELARITINGKAPANGTQARHQATAEDIAENIVADVMSLVEPTRSLVGNAAARCVEDRDAARVHAAHNAEHAPHRRRAPAKGEDHVA